MLIKRLGSDLHASDRSIDDRQLKATLDSLFHLEVARNTFLAFTELIEKMKLT